MKIANTERGYWTCQFKLEQKLTVFPIPRGSCPTATGASRCFSDRYNTVAEVIDRPLTEESRSALESALRYFRASAPKHTADEEESLFPRLRQLQDPEIEGALENLDALEEDHRKADALHTEIDALGIRCLDLQYLPPREAGRFRKAVTELASIYGEHIRIEDELVFPAAKLGLSSSQKLAIADEMAGRRNNH